MSVQQASKSQQEVYVPIVIVNVQLVLVKTFVQSVQMNNQSQYHLLKGTKYAIHKNSLTLNTKHIYAVTSSNMIVLHNHTVSIVLITVTLAILRLNVSLAQDYTTLMQMITHANQNAPITSLQTYLTNDVLTVMTSVYLVYQF